MDNNFRAAILHVVMDAFVSVLVIIAISIAGTVPHTNFLDPLAAIIGSFVILSWAYQLIRDTSSNLLDMNPDLKMTAKLQEVLERDGSLVTDLHIWRLGPGHLCGAISVLPPAAASVSTATKTESYYRNRIRGFKALSHVTIEVCDVIRKDK